MRAPSFHCLLLAVSGAIALTGCFNPSFNNSLSCSQEVGCPDGLVCISNVCERRAAGQPDSGNASFSFVDDDKSKFDQGTYEGTEWSGGLRLGEGVVIGRYLSRVFDGGRDPLQWNQFGFRPDAPYGIGLPDNGAVESGYRTGNVDMTESLLLLHCEDSIENTAPSEARPSTQDGALFSDALIQRGCEVAGDASLTIPNEGVFDFGTGDYTWATWLRTTTSCEDNDVFFGGDGQQNSPGGAHLWFGCARSDDERSAPECLDGAAGVGYFAGIQASVQSADGISFCGSTPINDGNWHHIAMVKSGTEEIAIRAYVDGRLEATAGGTFSEPIEFPANTDFGIGFLPNEGFNTGGSTTIDEFAVWARALSTAEVQSLVDRGATTAEFSVANCTDDACTGPFGDQTGELDGRIVDPGNNQPPAPVELEGNTARFFRYQVELQTINANISPIVESASVSGNR